MQLLALTLDERTPGVVVPERVQREPVAGPLHVETEAAVEVLGRLEVWHREDELVERVDADSAAFLWRHVAANGRHEISSDRIFAQSNIASRAPAQIAAS